MLGVVGATENAGVENEIRSKMQGWNMQERKSREQIAGLAGKCGSGKIGSRSQGWKMQEWKSREQIAGLENARVGLLYGKPIGDYSETALNYLLKIVCRFLTE